MFLINADSLLNIGVVSLIIYICISLLVAILVGYLFNYTLIKEIKKLTTKVDELSYPLSQIANNTSAQISKQPHSENTQVKNTVIFCHPIQLLPLKPTGRNFIAYISPYEMPAFFRISRMYNCGNTS